MMDVLDKIMMHPKTPKNAARTVERLVRVGKSVRVGRDLSRRRELVNAVPRKPEFVNKLDPVTGYGWLPKNTISTVPAAVAFAQKVLEDSRHIERPKKKNEEYLIHLSEPARYEEAPPLFDLAMSDEVLQMATEYLGEVPVMLRIWVLWTPVNSRMKGSQYWHRDGRKWFQKRAKFIFAANDVDEDSGPFTFVPGNDSERVSDQFGRFKMQDRVEDEDMNRFLGPGAELKMVGAAGSGLAIDTSRCFHFGSRSRVKERLLIMFQFWSALDLPPGRGDNLRRSPIFEAKFSKDPVRSLLIPDEDREHAPLGFDTD